MSTNERTQRTNGQSDKLVCPFDRLSVQMEFDILVANENKNNSERTRGKNSYTRVLWNEVKIARVKITKH